MISFLHGLSARRLESGYKSTDIGPRTVGYVLDLFLYVVNNLCAVIQEKGRAISLDWRVYVFVQR